LIPRKTARRRACDSVFPAQAPEPENAMVSKDILAEVAAERERQDGRWGGAEHDDEMTMDAFAQLIADYAGWARVKAREGTFDEARQRLVQAAALAVAAVECLDREKAQRDAPPAKPGGLGWE
jgi:hypothetical protein